MKVLAFLVTLIISPIINGFVLTKLWMWFAVPILNLPPIRIIEAIGLMIVIHYLKADISKEHKQYEGSFWEKIISAWVVLILYSGFFLFIGYLVKSLM